MFVSLIKFSLTQTTNKLNFLIYFVFKFSIIFIIYICGLKVNKKKIYLKKKTKKNQKAKIIFILKMNSSNIK